MNGWIGVDLDGTLAEYTGWKGGHHIGTPIAPMVDRVKQWIEQGFEVRIFTARAWKAEDSDIKAIEEWTEKHIGKRLSVTCNKDYSMIELWDDRAIRVIPNKGIPCCGLKE